MIFVFSGADVIINLPHHVSQRHPRMSMYNRTAQSLLLLPSPATRKPLRKQGRSEGEEEEYAYGRFMLN